MLLIALVVHRRLHGARAASHALHRHARIDRRDGPSCSTRRQRERHRRRRRGSDPRLHRRFRGMAARIARVSSRAPTTSSGCSRFPWLVVVLAMILAVLAAYFASSRPARAITKVPIVHALSGRPAPPRQIHRSAVPGIVFLVAAFLLLGYSGGTGGGNGNGGAPELLLGLVLLMPGLILLAPFFLSLTERVGRRGAHSDAARAARPRAVSGALRVRRSRPSASAYSSRSSSCSRRRRVSATCSTTPDRTSRRTNSRSITALPLAWRDHRASQRQGSTGPDPREDGDRDAGTTRRGRHADRQGPRRATRSPRNTERIPERPSGRPQLERADLRRDTPVVARVRNQSVRDRPEGRRLDVASGSFRCLRSRLGLRAAEISRRTRTPAAAAYGIR